MMIQKWVVLLQESGTIQKWLGYNDLGTDTGCDFRNAIRYNTEMQARNALTMLQRRRRWPQARIMGALEEESRETRKVRF